MERLERHIPQKSSSFSNSTREREDKKLRESDRNLSLDSIKFDEKRELALLAAAGDDKPSPIVEGKEDDADGHATDFVASATPHAEPSFASLSEDIDRLVAALNAHEEKEEEPIDIPDSLDRYVALVEREIIRFEAGDEKWSPESEQIPLLDALDRLHRLSSALVSDPTHFDAMSRTGGVLHHAMCFLEDEFFALLDEPRVRQQQQQQQQDQLNRTKRGQSFNRSHDAAVPQSPAAGADAGGVGDAVPPYPPETVARLRSIAAAMVAGGYGTECRQLFGVARRNAVDAGVTEQGFQKVSIDDVQRMAWESLEAEIVKWIKAFRHAAAEALPLERELCEEVFADDAAAAADIFSTLSMTILFHLLNFAEAVAMTKRSAEKLFKVLDMYEAIRDMSPKIDALFPAPAPCPAPASGEGEGEAEAEAVPDPYAAESCCPPDLRSEISSARMRIGDAAVGIFCELEGSIRSDAAKTPVPGGAVHPLTRYVMNYLKYACEYKGTLEQVFKEHQKLDKGPSLSSSDYDGGGAVDPGASDRRSPFAEQLVEVMDLLNSNIEGKSRLYRDLALSNIFMMNNGRYIVQKIKGSAEMNQLLGSTWCRRRSSDLRQYHKNYQRETWSKVLACFKDEGLTTGKGGVHKPVLKERLKSFNALFEEIHKTQSSWVVSDEQLQSELRVSVSAVVVPAYRSFLGRFGQYLTPGRQTEKYVKFGAEDLETYIDELFDGNPQSMVRRRT